MAEEGGLRVLGAHAAAVVRDPQEGHAAVADLYGDLGGPGVHGVFQQFLGGGGGALHHLARGNQVGDVGRQGVNDGHGFLLYRIRPMEMALMTMWITMGAKMVSAFS